MTQLTNATDKTRPQQQLNLLDSTCIIVGIIIGAGIYETAPVVAAGMGSASGTLLIWLIGGGLALAGALCYAELASAYPHEGGDYVYLNRAYASWAGYLFGWSQLIIIRPADIALLAFVFARYAQEIYAPFQRSLLFYAAIAVVVLTGINVIGVRQGKWTQNTLTIVKTVGLIVILIAALFAPDVSPSPPQTQAVSFSGLKLSLILVLFTFGGWNEMAYVAAEVKNPKRNIVRALIIGTVAVTVLYLLVNGAFLHALGYERMTESSAVAADTVARAFPDFAGRIVSALICISVLGAVNGLIFTGARISYAMGTDHTLFRALGIWSPRFGTPVYALLLQGTISLSIVLIAGSFIETIVYSAPVIWIFFLATGLSVFVLRAKEPDTPRPYRIIGYPLTPLLFCFACTFMFYSSLTYAWSVKPYGLLIAGIALLSGAIVYWGSESLRR